jgi:hypothetical protein
MRYGHHTGIRPIYRHVEEVKCIVKGPASQFIDQFCQRYGIPRPKARHGRVRLSLKAGDLKRLGLPGIGLFIRYPGPSCSVSYRTARPTIAAKELKVLFRGLGVTLHDGTWMYQEFYCVLKATDAALVRLYLPGWRGNPDKALERRGLRTIYGRELMIPVGVKGSLRVRVVMYQTRNTASPDRLKLEIRGPIAEGKKRPVLTTQQRNLMVVVLRELLSRAGVRAVEKPETPKKWIGTVFNDKHHDGSLQKRIRFILMALPSRKISFDVLAKFLAKHGSVLRANLTTCLRSMEKVGDVALTQHRGRIRSVRLFDFSRISLT